MANYKIDRAFTDLIHKEVALFKIYKQLGWQEILRDKDEAIQADIKDGIDYAFFANGKTVTVQERFREKQYAIYSDFTIRYRRDHNVHSDRKESEYYKIKADYFVYGVTNCDKNSSHTCSDFLKYAVVDLKKIYKKLDCGDIFIVDNGKNTCIIKEGKIECPIKYNNDNSSSFFPIEILFLTQLWGEELVLSQKGFI
ncbi:hypothetical protein [Halpernia sp. GG3]